MYTGHVYVYICIQDNSLYTGQVYVYICIQDNNLYTGQEYVYRTGICIQDRIYMQK